MFTWSSSISLTIDFEKADGVEFMNQDLLDPENGLDWIVAALPIHPDQLFYTA